jgi:DNA-binding MarR family transcriptional regulator
MKRKFKHDENMLFLLSKAHWKMHKLLNKRFKEAAILVTPDQWLLLLNLMNDGPMFQSELAKKQFKDRAAIKRLLDQLEKKDLVLRKRTEKDLRKKQVVLTETGQQIVEELSRISHISLQKATRDFTEVEINVLKRLVDRLEG